MTDDEIARKVDISEEDWRRLLLMAYQRDLNAMVGESQKPDWKKRRAAGVEICEMMGLSDAVKALNVTRAPKWPRVDVIPHGGVPGIGNAPGRLDCMVRTFHPDCGLQMVKISVPYRAKTKKGEKHVDPGAIEEAKVRGKFELGKRFL